MTFWSVTQGSLIGSAEMANIFNCVSVSKIKTFGIIFGEIGDNESLFG
jgi:hypothetical protein